MRVKYPVTCKSWLDLLESTDSNGSSYFRSHSYSNSNCSLFQFKLLDWSCSTAPSDSGSGLEEELDALSDQETRTPAESTACLRRGCECSLCARLYLSLQPWYWHSPMRLCTTFSHSHRLASTDFVHCLVVFEQTSKPLFLNEMMELYFHVFESFNFLWD